MVAGGIPREVRRPKALHVALALVAVGVMGKLALLQYANFETVFVACLLAGSLLGRWYTVLVPMAVLLVLQPLAWAIQGSAFALEAMAGISFFVVTGYLFVSLGGRAVKPRVLMRTRSVALLTSLSVPLTVAYDIWTDLGEWYFIARPAGMDLMTVLEMQVPFTLIHILSSLVFVPLFGSAFLLWMHHSLPTASPTEEPLGRGEGS